MKKEGVNMGGLGFPEMVVIMVIALIIFGPKKLPELGSSMGKAIRNFKNSTNQREEIDVKQKKSKEISGKE
jgi:sec-independent protein translocase protein TatA